MKNNEDQMTAAVTKARLSSNLRVALKARDSVKIGVLRSLIAAIDNAEAPPPAILPPHGADRPGASAEVERLLLDAVAVRCVVSAEAKERDEAASQFDRMG